MEMMYKSRDNARQHLQSDSMYSVAMVDFIGSGFDGYTCFKTAETLVDQERAITDTNALLGIFGNTDQKTMALTDTSQGQHQKGIDPARNAVVHGVHGDGLPIVCPPLEGGITVLAQQRI